MTGEHLELAQSVLDWWALAGVDQDFRDMPADLLDVGETVELPPVLPSKNAPRLATPAPAANPSSVALLPARSDIAMPQSLAEFRDWLKSSPDIPGAGPPAGRIAPSGPESAPLFVLTAMPDAIDAATGALLSGEPGALFDRMLAAIHIKREDIGLGSMALAPVPGGRLAAGDVALLTRIALRHIELARPKIVLLLGDKASRAILSTDAAKAQGRLLEIKLNQADIDAVATFHPRTLIRNSGFKRAAWESLQLVEKVLTPPCT
ncbi:MAG: hypothetical protein GW859_01640 [Sphingomonadales bacterium]|nr:hypothetical protein [Sphingomonadales bacterium]